MEEPNGSYIKIEQKTDINLDNVLVSSGTNIDALMEYFKHNTSQIFQRAAEKRFFDTVASSWINNEVYFVGYKEAADEQQNNGDD